MIKFTVFSSILHGISKRTSNKITKDASFDLSSSDNQILILDLGMFLTDTFLPIVLEDLNHAKCTIMFFSLFQRDHQSRFF
jgi:hypothetical protein